MIQSQNTELYCLIDNNHVLGIIYNKLNEVIPTDQLLSNVSVACKNALTT